MIRWIVESSLRLRFLLIALAAVLLVFGASQLRQMPVDVFPEFDPPLVEVQTEALGLPATDVESLITTPMEADLLNGVAWLDQIYSESVNGMSSILMVFEPGTDPIAARQMVQERLTQAFALPNVSKPPTMLQPLSSSNRLMMVGFSSKDLSLIDISVLAYWNVRPRLMGVPGVANVAIWGQRDRQLQVLVDPKKLHDNQVTLTQIIETTGEALWMSPLSYLESSSPGTAGFFDTPNQRISVRHELPIVSATDLAKVVLDDGSGKLLGDVATVVEDHQLLIGDAQFNNSPGLLMVIEKFPGANTLEVTKAVEEALENMKPGLTGIDINSTLFRPATYIEAVIGNLTNLSMIAALLVALLLLAFFFNWRSALIALLVIPTALVAATYVLYLRGATFNTMLLAGLLIALVAIIDDAIVATDNIARRLRQARATKRDMQGEGAGSAFAVVRNAMQESSAPLLVATLIVLLTVLPIFFMDGLMGTFLQPLLVSYVIATVVSLVVVLFVTPALSMILLGNASLKEGATPFVGAFQSLYRAIVAPTIGRPGLAYLLLAVFVIAGLVLAPTLTTSLVPTFRQNDLVIQWQGAPGTAASEMNRIMTNASAELRAIPGVLNVGSHVGRAVTGDQVVGANSSQLWINLDPAADYAATMDTISEIVNGYPGLSSSVGGYQPRRTGQALVGNPFDLVVRIYGVEFDEIRSKAQEVQAAIAKISGVTAAQALIDADEPSIEIEVDLVKAEEHNIKPGDVRRASSTLLSGLQVGNLYEEQKVFDVVVWGVPDVRNNLNHIGDMLLDKPDGTQVRLGDVADVRIAPSPVVIRRDTVSRFTDVGLTISGRSLSAVIADVKTSLKGIQFPNEYHAEVMGEALEQQNTFRRMLGVAVAALIGILLLLHASFGRWRLALVAVVAFLMALSGGVIAARLGGGVLSLGSIFGFLAVLAIATRQGLVMLNHFSTLERHEKMPFGGDLVVRGVNDRLGSLLMTTLATVLVLLPLFFVGNGAGTEILRSMALVILGGLVTTTLLNLFVLPALYLRFGPIIPNELPGMDVGVEPAMRPA